MQIPTAQGVVIMSEQHAQPQRIRVFVEDHTGNKRREAGMASQAPVRDLVPAVITALNLPATDPRGRPVNYHLVFNDRQLQADETLIGAGVTDGSTLTVVPEMTAGCNKWY